MQTIDGAAQWTMCGEAYLLRCPPNRVLIALRRSRGAALEEADLDRAVP